jgi:ubiquinone/menaquinone biosynthesis C-methylase UbiE
MKRPPPPKPNFDRIARAYRWLEYASLGPVLEHLRLYHLGALHHLRSHPAQALILGDGDGRFSARLLATYPTLEADAVDLSRTMLTLLQTRTAGAGRRIHLHHQDALDFAEILPPRPRYDLIVTHFFLDCLTQPQVHQLIDTVSSATRPGALWLVSEFRIPEGILRWPARLYLRGLYFVFRLLTGLRTTHLPDYAAALRQAGWQTVASHRALLGLLTTDLWQRTEPASVVQDAIPDPEPIAPSLTEADPGVFRHSPSH